MRWSCFTGLSRFFFISPHLVLSLSLFSFSFFPPVLFSFGLAVWPSISFCRERWMKMIKDQFTLRSVRPVFIAVQSSCGSINIRPFQWLITWVQSRGRHYPIDHPIRLFFFLSSSLSFALEIGMETRRKKTQVIASRLLSDSFEGWGKMGRRRRRRQWRRRWRGEWREVIQVH